MSTDILHSVQVEAGYAGATINSATDTDSGVIVDTQGFGALAYACYMGAITDGSYVLKVMESDAANFANPTEVAQYLTPAADRTFTKSPTDHSNLVKSVQAIMTKRYAKLRITSATVSSGAVVKGAVALLSARRLPSDT